MSNRPDVPPTGLATSPRVVDGAEIRRVAGLAPRRRPSLSPDKTRPDDLLVVVIDEADVTMTIGSGPEGIRPSVGAEPVEHAVRLPWALDPYPARWRDAPSTGPTILVVAYDVDAPASAPVAHPSSVAGDAELEDLQLQGGRTEPPGDGDTRAVSTLMIAGVACVDSARWEPVDPAEQPWWRDDIWWTLPVKRPLQDPTGGALDGARLDLGHTIDWLGAARWTTNV